MLTGFLYKKIGTVPLPLLSLFLFDELLRKMIESDHTIQENSDDLFVIIEGIHDKITSDLVETALNMIQGY